MTLRPSSFLQVKWLPILVMLGLGLVYLFLPTHNPTPDAYYYAACVRWQVELWQPHHLLYNMTGLGLFYASQQLGYAGQPLELMQAMNALAATGCLFVLWQILRLLQKEPKIQAALLLLAGSSLGFMRYATENETYIIPILFSLLGSYYWIKYSFHQNHTSLFWSSFWAAVACLFHQIHFFWWLGLFVSALVTTPKKGKAFLWFALPALVVPLGYAFVLHLQDIPFTQAHTFVFHDFYEREVETTITYQHFLLTGISFFRTFLEAHGRIIFLVKENLINILPALLTLILLSVFLLKLYRKRKEFALERLGVFRSHFFILVLQLLFAWYAVGNAEFMVMLPFAAVIMISCFSLPKASLLFFLPALGLFIWNMAYAVLPNYFFTYANHACVQKILEQQPQAVLLLQDKNSFDAYQFYHTGRYPGHAYETWADPALLSEVVQQARQENKPVITDFSREAQVISRAWILKGRAGETFFQQFELQPITSCPTFYGNGNLYLVRRPAPQP